MGWLQRNAWFHPVMLAVAGGVDLWTLATASTVFIQVGAGFIAGLCFFASAVVWLTPRVHAAEFQVMETRLGCLELIARIQEKQQPEAES